jgi:amino acid adenylation domain-containing protein
MVPNLYLALDALPRLPNGKLDRLSLPAPDAAMAGLPSVEQAPESETERILQDIWSTLLDIPPAHISRYGNFFELGGHSLLATKLLYRIKEKLSLSLSLATLLDNSTLSHLAKTIDAERARAVPATVASTAALSPDPENRHQPFPLTDIQQAYWLGRQAMPGSRGIATHRYQEFRLPNFDLKRFSDALNLLIRRHDMLRVVIRPEGLQQILEHVPEYQIRHTDLRDLPDDAVATCLRRVRDELSHQVLDPSRWPVFEFRATRVDDVYTHLHISTDMLLLDASSSRLLANELNQLYTGDVSALPPLGLSFRDYVLAEQSMHNGPEYLRARDYWRQRLSDFAPAPELPLAIDPEQVESPRFTRRAASLKAADWTRLSERARHIGVTPSVVLLAAFSAVLAVWSKQPRYTLNLTLSNRLPLHPEVDALVGDFTSLILLEANMAPVRPFTQYAQALQAQLWRDMDHAAFSGVQVLRELAQMHGMQFARMPVVFTSTLGDDHKQPDTKHATLADTTGAIGETVFGISQSSQVWLDHQVSERAGELIFEWDSFEEIFPDGMLDAMFDAYCRLLHRLVEDDGVWLTSGVDLLPPSCRAMQDACNNTDAPISDALLHELFDRQARIAPERIAVIAQGRTLSYGELHVMARQLGAQLQSLGAAPNRLIAVVMEKGWEQAVATLGILYAGAAYLPIDPALPAERLHRILESAEASIALTQSALESRIAWPPGIMRIPVDRQNAADGENKLQPVTVSPQDLAYVIFTSGSTGVPKGVMIDHRGAVNTILDINDRFAVTPTDRIFALSSLSFDLSVFDIFGALAAGAAVVIPAAGDMRDPAQWIKVLAKERVTIWNSVPALLGMLVEHAQNNDSDLPPLALRLAMLSGDWIPLALPDRIRALLPSLNIVSLGGATEASIWSIYHPIGRVMPQWRSIPYGTPLRNQRFYVLDDALHPRPAWVPGQLYIGGIGLAKGYWRDPQKTDASFIHHPVTQERLYKTGDLGRYLPDGTIEFLGREDFQIKVQGYRIELGDIEAALDSCPDVVASAVSAIGDARGEKSLVAYVVPRDDGKPLSNEKLSAFLSNKLPRYMVPTRFVSLERLPLTSNGKVDRKALPAPNAAVSGSRQEAPSTPTEKALADIWSAQLDGCRIGVHDSFFELGGNSLDAIRMIQAIKRRFNVTLPPAAVFNTPALADLAEMIDTGRASHSLVVPLAADNDLPALFCIHPAGGQVHSYRELAQVLKDKFRVYAIQSPEAAGAELNFDSLDAMARTYCAVMTATQPAGSYRLVAWSTGAPIAMAIAAQLEDQGRDVEYLALLDPAALPSAPMDSQNGEVEHARMRDALLAALAAVRGSSFSAEEITGMEASLRESGLSIVALLHERNRDIASNHVKKWTGMDATPDIIEHLLFLVKTTQRHFALLAGYAPRPVRGPLHHCLAVESRNAFHKDSAPTQHTSIVGGNHYTMLKEPHVRQLADAMTSFIDKQAKADDTASILDKQ